MDNNDFLIGELDGLIKSLMQYREALAAQDKDALTKLLEDGSRIKGELDH
jgi:prephenate dehydrogenase